MKIPVVPLIAGLAVTTALIKASGPALLGGRRLPAWATAVVAGLAPALLCALVLVETFADGSELVLDPGRTAGVAVAAAAAVVRAPIVVVILLAAATAAGVRAVT